MNYTTNYNLKKPAGSDAINVGDFNDNADTLDTTLKSVSDTANGKYIKPASGIPKTDLASAVQTAIDSISGKYTKPATGIPESDLAEAVQAKLDGIVMKIGCVVDTPNITANTAFSEWTVNGETKTLSQLTSMLSTAVENGDAIQLDAWHITSSYPSEQYINRLSLSGYHNDTNGETFCFCDNLDYTHPQARTQFVVLTPDLTAHGYAETLDTSISAASTNNGIPTSLAVKNYLTTNYSTTAQMNTAIATAIGDAIGGSY